MPPAFHDVFVAGKETCTGHNEKRYAQFREGGVALTNSGQLVVVVQGRNASKWSDRSGQDLWCKRSADLGETWSEPTLVVTHGAHSICPQAVVYDAEHDRIHVLYNVHLWDYTEGRENVSGLPRRCKQYHLYSDDEGATWSTPRDITDAMRVEPGQLVIFGSGEGIQLRQGKYKGRLVVPGGDFVGGKKVYAFLSEDHGETWRHGTPAPSRILVQCETSIAELPDGTLILNSRSNEGEVGVSRFRRRAFSHDGGQTWTELEEDRGLPSVGCNASVITVPDPEAETKTLLLYAGPTGPRVELGETLDRRSNGTVFVSRDGGQTWPYRKLVVNDLFAYSSLVRLSDGTVALVYEARDHKDIKLVRFSLEWLLATP